MLGLGVERGESVTGHTQEKTFNRYVKADDKTARVIAALDRLREAKRAKEEENITFHQVH